MSLQKLLAFGGPDGGRWLEEKLRCALSAWPDPRTALHVETRELCLEEIPDVPTSQPVAADARSLDSREVLQVLDRFRACEASGVVLVTARNASIGHSLGGMIVCDAETPTATLAPMLHAIGVCASATAELRRELKIAQRTSGGVREEMSRMSQELSLASRIQQELVPKAMPKANGMDYGVLYRPAGYVSGDIYNIARLDDRRTAFFIADAVGHGVPAALLTMIISRALPMQSAGGAIISPSDALSAVNHELCGVSDGTPRFATAVYGVIDTETGLVRIANAGHPQPMRIAPERVAKVEAGGPLLGVFREASFDEETFTLEPGETLLLYSDGFETAFPDTDAMRQGRGVLPSDRYVEQLLRIGRTSRKNDETVVDALATLERRLDEAHGSLHQVDDVTALALERKAA
ncbi:MAG: PP2C family protein-serine/threonine phosphatase [Planctomycetota bacterium]